MRRDSWSPAYGRRESARVVNFGAQVELPADFATLVVAGDNSPANLGRLVKVNDFAPESVCGYQYSNLRQEHSFFFGGRPGPWALGVWASDADFLCWSVDREKEQYSLVLCNGSYAAVGGRRVLTCARRVSYAEVLSSSGNVDLFSSDPDHVVLQQSLDRVLADGDLIVPGQ